MSQIEKNDLDELISSVEGALGDMGDVEGQAAMWDADKAGELEALASSAYSEIEDVLLELRRIRKGLS